MKPSSPTLPKNRPLGEILVQMGLLTSAELQAALAYRQENGLKLGQALVALRLVTQGELAHALRDQGTIHCLDLVPEIVDRQTARELGEERSRQMQAVAVNRIAGIVTVAVEDPTDSFEVDALSLALNAPVFAVHAEPERIAACLDHVFGPASAAPAAAPGAPAERADVRLDLAEEEERAPEEDLELAAARLLGTLLEDALAAGASALHVEPRAEDLVVRFRVDGELRGGAPIARTWAQALFARLKLLGDLDVAERRLPQEGKARAELRGRRVELRIALSPSVHGECAVVRIHDAERPRLDLEELPFEARQREELRGMIEGGGLVLAAGPGGHGRTSTLHALLRRSAAAHRKLVTVEDPVEHHVDGAVQVHVDASVGLTFARAARGALALDPDVLLIGELRDLETAEVAVQAALAGKLVLSTLHASGAAEAILRLADLGLEPYVLADALRGVVAQRLVRRLCPQCRRAEAPTPEAIARFAPGALPGVVHAAVGCEHCSYTGFRGRTALYEVLAVDAALWDAIRTRSSAASLRDVARAHGFRTLREDGLQKVFQGETTLDEVHAATVWRGA